MEVQKSLLLFRGSKWGAIWYSFGYGIRSAIGKFKNEILHCYVITSRYSRTVVFLYLTVASRFPDCAIRFDPAILVLLFIVLEYNQKLFHKTLVYRMDDASRRRNLLDGSIIEGAKEQLLAKTSDVQQFAGNAAERVGLLKAKEELGIFKGH